MHAEISYATAQFMPIKEKQISVMKHFTKVLTL